MEMLVTDDVDAAAYAVLQGARLVEVMLRERPRFLFEGDAFALGALGTWETHLPSVHPREYAEAQRVVQGMVRAAEWREERLALEEGAF